MAAVAAALAVGIAAGRFSPMTTGFWAVLAAAGLVTTIVTFRLKHLHLLTCWAVAITVLAIGAVHVRLVYFHLPDSHIVTYAGQSQTMSTIRGRLATAPKSFSPTGGVKFGYKPVPVTGMLVEANAIQTSAGWQPAEGLVRVIVKEPVFSLEPGQTLELVGKLSRLKGPSNPGQFDWAKAARDKHTLVRFTVECAGGVSVVGGDDTGWLTRALRRLRASARQHLALTGDDRGSSVLAALLLGERDQSLRSLNQSMVRSGVAHFLSISGLHLGVFLGFVFLICRLLLLSPRRSAIVVLAVLGAYMLIAEPRAPLLRSAMMATALCAALIFRRPQASLNALAVAAVVLLAIDPLQLFSAAFQLSFVIVAGLLLFCRNVEDLLFGRFKRLRGLMVFRGRDRLRRWMWYTLGNTMTGAVAMALTAYVVAAPLVAYHFGLFCPYAAVLSLLLFPLVLAVLVPGYIAMALAPIMPGLSHSIAQLAGGAANALAGAVQALQVLPGMSFELNPTGPLAPLLCYAAMLLVAARRRVRLARIGAATTALAAVAILVWSQLPAAAPADAELHVLSVGAGQCVVLRTPGGKTVLIDAGTQSGFDLYAQTYRPFMLSKGFDAPTAAFISHANSDHYNALPALLQWRRLDTVYVNEYFAHKGARDELPESEQRIWALLLRGAERIVRLIPGENGTVQIDERTSIQVLWPQPGRTDLNINDTSLVLRVQCDDKSVLLCGDLDTTGQRELAAMGDAVKADAIILPHHGAWRETLKPFVEAVSPKIVLTSGSVSPAARASGRPDALTFFADLARRTRCHSTARNGYIRLTFGRGDIQVDCMRR